MQNIKNAGYKPIRIMFYYTNRDQAVRIQETLKTIYLGIEREYYRGDAAWSYVKKETNVDLFNILQDIVKNKTEK